MQDIIVHHSLTSTYLPSFVQIGTDGWTDGLTFGLPLLGRLTKK